MGSQQRRREGQGIPALACLPRDSFVPLCTGIPLTALPGQGAGFLLAGGLFGCGASRAPGAQPRSLWLVPQDACRAFTSHLFIMNIIFLLRAHSSFQTFGQAAPCLVQAGVWLQRCLFFLFSLLSCPVLIKMRSSFFSFTCPLGSPSIGCPLLSIVFTSLVIERGMDCKNLMIDRTQRERTKRIFQPLYLLVAHLQSTKWSRAD